MKGLLRSTWSGLSSLSRRAVAEIGSRYTEQQPTLPSQENVYLLPGWAVKRRHQVEAKDRDRGSLVFCWTYWTRLIHQLKHLIYMCRLLALLSRYET
jgi:hypothetical protein